MCFVQSQLRGSHVIQPVDSSTLTTWMFTPPGINTDDLFTPGFATNQMTKTKMHFVFRALVMWEFGARGCGWLPFQVSVLLLTDGWWPPGRCGHTQGSPKRSCRRLRAATSTHWSSCWVKGVTCRWQRAVPGSHSSCPNASSSDSPGVPRGHPWALRFALPDDLWTGASFQMWMDR